MHDCGRKREGEIYCWCAAVMVYANWRHCSLHQFTYFFLRQAVPVLRIQGNLLVASFGIVMWKTSVRRG